MGTYSSNTTIKVVGGTSFNVTSSTTIVTLAANQYAMLDVSFHQHQDLAGTSQSELKIDSVVVSRCAANSSTVSIGKIDGTTGGATYSQQRYYVAPFATVSFLSTGGTPQVTGCITIFQNTP